METVMKNPNIIYVRALDCSKSPLNVRTQSDAEADAELEANIGETGIILQNLIGVAVPRQRGHYAIFGGGRRLDRVHSLIAKGVFGEDFMIPILPAKNARDAIEMSLAENYFNLPMNPADECRAFQAIIEREKKTAADVAKRFGKTERFVLGRLRLAGLADRVFEALRCGEITIDVATAYASTADSVRQASVFAELTGLPFRHNVSEIRRRLASGSYAGGDPKAVFVGRDVYLAAGGAIESDLFSDDASELWTDGELIDRLVADKLAEAAAAVRLREGFGEVRTVAASHIPYSETYDLERVQGEPTPLSSEALARKQEIEAEMDAIEAAAAEVEDYSEDQSQRLEQLEEELGALVETPIMISDEQRAGAIAYLVIGSDGEPRLHEQLYAAPVSSDDEPEPAEAAGEADTGETPADDDGTPRYSQRLSDELAMMKTELIALHVAGDPQFALDLGTFIMVDAATRAIGTYDLPSELRANKPTGRVAGFSSETPAAAAWTQFEEALDRTWLVHKAMIERYDAFCGLPQEARAAWFGWSIARTLQAVTAGSVGDGFLNHIGAKLRIDVAAWWRPTARNFFDRVSKKQILGLLEDVGGSELKNRFAAARKFDLAASSEKLFSGQLIAEAEVKDRALAWLPAPMRLALPEADDAPPPLSGEIAHRRDEDGDGTREMQTAEAEGDLSEAA
jgi:ParB family chromosome partitioning protein